MKDVTISIIIPCYNVEKYISRTVESIKKQEKINFEVIFINDGSTDNTLKVLKEALKGASFNYNIIEKANEGVSASRNIGIRKAKGKYVYFLDGDDTINSDLSIVIEEEIQATDCDIYYFGYDHVDINNNILKPVDQLFKYSDDTLVGPEAALKMLKGEIFINSINGVYRLELLIRHDLEYTLGMKVSEDEEFINKAVYHAKKVKAIKKLLAHYLKRSGANFQVNENQTHRYKTMRNLLNYFKEINAKREVIEVLQEHKIPYSTINAIIILAKGNFDLNRLLDIIKTKEVKENLKKYKVINTDKASYKLKVQILWLLYFPKSFIRYFRGNKVY